MGQSRATKKRPPADTGEQLELFEMAGRATVIPRHVASILTPASGFMSAYKFTLNPYSGCTFACDYCYARFFAPTPAEQAQWGRLVGVRLNGADLVRRAMHSRSPARRLERGDAIYMSSVTDPYQPIEAKRELTRQLLEALIPVQPRLTIQTRSPLATRDIDLFQQFTRIRVNFTITTDSEAMRLRYEPHSPAIGVRLEAAAAIAAAGVPIGVSISPMLPLDDAAAFGRRVAALDAAEYVTQFFKPARARFSAGSTPEALSNMKEDGWTKARYQAARAAIATALGPARPLLEGSAGYAPPG